MKIAFSAKHKKIFQQMGIQTIYLFGSQANGTAHSLSDVDFGVVLKEPQRYQNKTLELYLKLYEIFSDALPKDYLRRRFQLKGHEFDIVFLQFVPVYLQFEAATNGKVLYENCKESTLDYKEKVSKMFCDLQYFYNISRQGMLERI